MRPTLRLSPLLLLAVLALPACGETDDDPEFTRDYVDDFESDAAEDAAEAAEMAILDEIDDLDDPEAAFAAAAAGGGLRAQAARPPHGPLSILEDRPHFVDPAHVEEAQRLGADVVRVLVSWKSLVPGDPEASERPTHVSVLRNGTLQPVRFSPTNPEHYVDAAGNPRWAEYDAIVDNARARGMKVLLTLSAPMPFWGSEQWWYCRRARDVRKDWSCGWRPDTREYARFVTAAGRHFRGKVWAYTLWNEPNIGDFLNDGTLEDGFLQSGLEDPRDPKVRTSMFKAAMRYRKIWFTAFKALRRTAKVDSLVFFGDTANDLIGPGDAGCDRQCGTGKPSSDPACKACGQADDDPTEARWALLRWALCLDPEDGKLLEGDEAARCPERPRRVFAAGVAFHPYAPSPTATKKSVENLQRLTDSAVRRGRLVIRRLGGVYVTEFGYLTMKGPRSLGAGPHVSLTDQALHVLPTEQAMYENGRVRTVAQYELFDDAAGGWECGLRFAQPASDAYVVALAKELGTDLEGARARLGTPKPALAAYAQPMIFSAKRVAGDQVQVTGFLRSADERTSTLLVEGLVNGGWAPMGQLTVDAAGYGKVTVPASGATSWRLHELATGKTGSERVAQ